MDTEFLKYIKRHIELFIQTNIEEVDPQDRPEIDIIWDTLKAYIRGIMLGYAAKKKADLDNEMNKLTKHISTLEKKHRTQINSRTLTELQELKLKLDSLLLKKANDYRHNSNKLNYISANKSGKHLTSLIKKVLKKTKKIKH